MTSSQKEYLHEELSPIGLLLNLQDSFTFRIHLPSGCRNDRQAAVLTLHPLEGGGADGGNVFTLTQVG